MTPTADELARETAYTADEWQHALNALGDRADGLLATVKGLAARQGLTPLAAVQAVLAAVPDGDEVMIEPTDAQIAVLSAFLNEEPEPRRTASVRDFFPDGDDLPPGPERDAALAALRAADLGAQAEHQTWMRRLVRAVLNA